MEVVFITAFAIAFVILLKISGKTRQERFLDSVPGPRGFPIIGNFFDIFQTRRNFVRLSVENEAKFGSVYKLWIGSTPIVFISKPEYVETIFGTKGSIREPDEKSLITKSVKIHPYNCPRKRNIVALAVNTRKPDSIIKITNDNCQILVNALKLKLRNNNILHYETVSLCVLDSISEFILGVKINSQIGENSPFAVSLLRLCKLAEKNHKLQFYKDSLFKMTSYGKEYFFHLNLIREFIKKIIGERGERNRHSQDSTDVTNILDHLFIYNGIYTTQEIHEEILNLILSAFELINPSVYSLLCVAGSQTNMQNKILHEIETVSTKNQENQLTIKDMQRMLYLDRVVKETLRLFPPCPFIVKETERDNKIGNYVIPYGTTICIQLVNLHRDSDSYPNADNFDPDNFLLRNTKTKNRFSFIPFGIPDSNCLGQKPTEIIQRIIFINLIRAFAIETVQQSKDNNFTSISSYIQQLNNDIKLRLILRSN